MEKYYKMFIKAYKRELAAIEEIDKAKEELLRKELIDVHTNERHTLAIAKNYIRHYSSH